jgi:hypothetical protein
VNDRSFAGLSDAAKLCDESGSEEADAHVRAVLSDGEIDVEIEGAGLTIMRETLGVSGRTE